MSIYSNKMNQQPAEETANEVDDDDQAKWMVKVLFSVWHVLVFVAVKNKSTPGTKSPRR